MFSRDERPPQISSPSISSGTLIQRRWVPPSSQKRDVVNNEERDNVIFRKVRGILNKLTPEKFDKLSLELLNIGIDSKHILKGIILLIFEKALDEPKYSSLYAQLCHRLCEDAPNFEATSSKITSFKRLLLNKCQDEFENRSRAFEAFDKDVPLTIDEEEQSCIAKHKMLGNIKFIGELGKLDMLHEGILHRCIQQLLEKKKKKQTIQDLGEDYECLCQIMRTVGKSLDHDKARLWMDQYFDRIRTIMSNPELPSRIRFMLLDVLELRSNQWMPRKILLDTGPKTIQQVREDAIKYSSHEYTMMPHPNSHMANLSMNTDLFGRSINGTVGPPKSMMGDIFGPMSPTFMASNSGIGTGPGVLPVDDFTPAFLSGNAGKQHNFKQAGSYGNRGKQQEGRGGNSPRFDDRYRNRNNNTPPFQHPEKEADREDEADDNYPVSRGRRDNYNNYNNRYGNNRDNRQQGNQPHYNRDSQNQSQPYRGRNEDRSGTNTGSNFQFSGRQRSPYNQDEMEEKPRENRSSDDNWRRDGNRDRNQPAREEDNRERKRDVRDDPYRPPHLERSRDIPQRVNRDEIPQRGNRDNAPQRGNRDDPPLRGNRENPPLRGNRDDPPHRGNRDDPLPRGNRDEWERDQRRDGERDKPRQHWHSDRSDSGERDPREKDKDYPRRDDFNKRDDRPRQPQQGSRPYKEWDSYDGRDKREPTFNRDNRDREYFKGSGRDFDRDGGREHRDFQNGDVPDQGDRFGREGDFRSRDFNRENRNRDFSSNNRDFRDNRDFNRDSNRDFHDNRDFRDNKDGRDNKGFRDFGESRDRGGYDRDRGFQFQRGTTQQQQPRDGQQPAARELPPRFQRKQQQQQGPSPDPLFPTEIPSPSPEDPLGIGSLPAQPGMPPGAPPQRFRHPLQSQRPPHPGYFPPRFPPPGAPPMRGPPPRGFPGGPPPPHGMPPPRYPLSGSPRESGLLDGPRDGGGPTPGGPGQSPPQNLPKGPAKIDEISLRPARNFPTMLRPSAPSMLPKSAQNPHLGPSSTMQMPSGPDLLGPGPGGPQPGMKPTNLTIKQVSSTDRNKDKRKVPNKEELKLATEELMKEFLETSNVEETVATIREMKPPRRFMPEMISMLIVVGLEKGDTERENISKLIHSMKAEAVLASDLYLDGLCSVLDRMSELEQEIPLVKSNVAKFAAQAVGSDIITLSNLAEPLNNGAHYPFFLLCLQQLHKLKDEEWLIGVFNDSKIELLSMLPECDRTKERMVEILDDRNLSFMFPLLRVQSDLWRQVRSDPNPTNFYKWIKENVDLGLQSDPGFINILITTILRYVTAETSMRGDQDSSNPDKAALDKEKDLFDKFKGVLQRFLLDRVDLQMTAIYAIQVFGHSADFPKGMMLRMFMHMYDLEIIDEETFLKWKEEVNDEYPGKGKVLFQVHQWLTWLEQAEEESEEEDN